MISMIAAMGKNRVIGHGNDMPWHLPKDLAHFKKVTTGHTVIMGRKTYESIGRPLPNRKNVLLTRRKKIDVPGNVTIIRSIETIFKWEEEDPTREYFIIGGGELYKQMISSADRLYITEINESFHGDTFFPKIYLDEWEVVSEITEQRDNNNPYDLKFLIYERRKN